MKLKKTFLVLAIVIFMVFSLSFATSDSLAYWATSINGNNNTEVATVTIGTWAQAFPWDINETYAIGDQVTNNGVTYQAKKDNPTKEPGVDGGWNSQWLIV
jgi:hypothetical protein